MHTAACEAEKASSSTSTQTCRRFSLAEITSATNNFDDDQVIGQGGFGKVYKGIIYTEHISHEVAIKRLDSMSNQGAAEFRTEIEMLSKVRHCHLVSLIGFCDENKEMILVYEYMPHGTLYNHLHKAVTNVNWVQRLKIAIGAARGLDYLHTGFNTQQGIIHRDVKSSNILLDKEWAAKISDFGLSKVGPTNQSISYVDASVKGTFGYLDPDYFYTRKLTRKTDVYAFGVVLFELLSGRLPVDERYGEEQCSLVRWAQKCVKDRKLDQMVDSSIRGTVFPLCLRRFAYIANQCLLNIPKKRPNMTEVVASLQVLLELQEKYNDSASSSSTTWLTSKLSKYLALLSTVNSDHVGTSMSTGGAANAHQETPTQFKEMDLVSENFQTTPDRFSYSKLTMSQVAGATQYFSSSLRLGEGGFETLYKTQLLDGQVVDIKRANKVLESRADGNGDLVNKKKTTIIRGMLSITVISAEDLPSTDLLGKADRFVMVTMKKTRTKYSSRVVKGNLNPVWNNTFDFIVEDGLHDMLIVEVYNNGTFGKDYMGRCILALTRVILEGKYTDCFPLDGARSGKLHMHLQWFHQPIFS